MGSSNMLDVTIRLLGEDEWRLYREVRLAALREAPAAFVARFADEESHTDNFWRERMMRSCRIVAERGDEPIGMVCLALSDEDPETGEVFGLWTAPTARGQRIAWDLVTAACKQAAEEGCTRLYFWAGSDNASAIGFASSFGFRPTGERRPVQTHVSATESDTDEVALTLPLAKDPTQPANPYLD